MFGTDRVDCKVQMNFMKECLQMAKRMEEAEICGIMAKDMMENGLITVSMARELGFSQMVNKDKVNLIEATELDG